MIGFIAFLIVSLFVFKIYRYIQRLPDFTEEELNDTDGEYSDEEMAAGSTTFL